MKSTLISSALFLATVSAAPAADITYSSSISFEMVVSQGARTCLPDARAQVSIQSSGIQGSIQSSAIVEDMFISVSGLPPNTEFHLFIIQVPNAPFGLSWYQGDLETDDNGNAMQHFRGRFSIQTFIVAPGAAAAPLVFNNPPFPDAAQNPATGAVHTYHLGLWFNSPTDAQKVGCPSTVTPFNGGHNAGIQVLNSSNYPDNLGPLGNLNINLHQ